MAVFHALTRLSWTSTDEEIPIGTIFEKSQLAQNFLGGEVGKYANQYQKCSPPKGLPAEVRNKLDAIMAQIAGAIASGQLSETDILGSKVKLQIGKKVRSR